MFIVDDVRKYARTRGPHLVEALAKYEAEHGPLTDDAILKSEPGSLPNLLWMASSCDEPTREILRRVNNPAIYKRGRGRGPVTTPMKRLGVYTQTGSTSGRPSAKQPVGTSLTRTGPAYRTRWLNYRRLLPVR